jgi:hypothetical protein
MTTAKEITSHDWKLVTSNAAHAAEVMRNLEINQYKVMHVSVGEALPDGTVAVYVSARHEIASMWSGGIVEVGGHYTPRCGCGAVGKNPGAELGCCMECFRDVEWDYAPFPDEGA